ncbi:MAG: hypothetical protein ACQESR_11140 [Planctomycetota bacterium]
MIHILWCPERPKNATRGGTRVPVPLPFQGDEIILQAVESVRGESCPTPAVFPWVGLAADKVIRDRYNVARLGGPPSSISILGISGGASRLESPSASLAYRRVIHVGT